MENTATVKTNRKTFTDYLDDVHGKYYDPAYLHNPTSAYMSNPSLHTNANPGWSNQVGRLRGNPNNKDWYSFAGVIITISLKSKKEVCPNPY